MLLIQKKNEIMIKKEKLLKSHYDDRFLNFDKNCRRFDFTIVRLYNETEQKPMFLALEEKIEFYKLSF